MSGWNPRRASERLPLLLLLTAVVVAGPSGAAAPPPGAGPVPVLRLANPDPDPDVRSALEEDRAWLRALPPLERLLPAADAADTGAAGAAWRERLRGLAQGAPDSLDVVGRTAAGRLADRWRDRGRLEVTVAVRRGGPGPDGSVAPDTLVVAPGPPWAFGAIAVEGDGFLHREHLLRAWLPREGDRYDPEALAGAVDRILAGAGEAGYPWARWMTTGVSPDPATRRVDVEARLIPGRRAVVGPLSTSLPTPRASDFALRTSGLRSGDPFRESDLAAAVDRLLARDLYARVDPPVVHVTTARDTVGIHLPLVPRAKANRLAVVLGLSRRDEGSSRVSGQVDLDLPNLAGTGRALQVGWRDDGERTARFGFRYLEPLVFGTPLDTDLSLEQEVQRDSYTRIRLENRWRLPVVALWGVELGLGWDRATFPVGDLANTRRLRARGAVLHRRGDRTRSGWEGQFAVEEAWRSAVARADTGGAARLGEAVTQRIFEVDAAGEWRLTETLGLFGRSAFREQTGGPDVAPLSEHFRFGGANTLRGYGELAFHGTRAAWGAVELRVGRATGSRLYTFYDLGYFAFGAREPLPDGGERTVVREGWPRGYGLGLLARTRAGDLSLAVGFPGTVDFDLAKLHVTLLESF